METQRIRIARSSRDLDAAFAVRHKVFVEEENYMPPREDGRILDRFDAFPTTAIVIAEIGGEVVGTMRFTEYSSVGASPDAYFDFRPHFPPGARMGSSAQLVMMRKHRKTHGLSFAMMAMGYLWCIESGLTHLTAVINPDAFSVLKRSGWQALAPEFFDERHQLRCIPAMLELSQLNDRFTTFVRTQSLEHFFKAFERAFLRAGDTLFHKGDTADAAYVVVEGSVAVLRDDGTEIMRAGPTEVVGELALLTGRPRAATIIAVKDTSLMVVDRETFDTQLEQRPSSAREMLRLLAERYLDNNR